MWAKCVVLGTKLRERLRDQSRLTASLWSIFYDQAGGGDVVEAELRFKKAFWHQLCRTSSLSILTILSVSVITRVIASSTKAVRGASLLILLQVISRAITFIANQLLLRFLTAQLLGIATQLEVYYLTVIFFARESLRVAIQRQDTTTKKDTTTNSSAQAAINLGYLSIALGIPLAVLFGLLYRASLTPATLASTPHLLPSLYLYALASILELLSEPSFVLTQTRLLFTTRATAESTATLLRCLTTLLTASLVPSSGVLPFALGQLAHSLGLLTIYTLHAHRLSLSESFSLLPTPLPPSPTTTLRSLLPTPPLRLASSLLAQSLVKHLLTQGDTLLVSILSTPSAQGIYALASNYGSLAARLVFQPVEESSRAYFSRPAPAASQRAALAAVLRAYALLSLLIATLAPPAAPLLLGLVAGPRWAGSGAGGCLAAYMYYLPLLALNGVAEAFVSSVATEGEVHRQSAWMGAFSVGFAGAGFVFLRVLGWGAEGLVWANGINMACRIVWCAVFIGGYFAKRGEGIGWGEVMPRPLGVGAAAVVAVVVRRVVDGEVTGVKETLGQLVRVAGVGVPFLGVLMFSERRFLQSSYQALMGKTKTS
ncbi:oligosaccharide translocation protein RFT1 [Podospora conica]|nr:oligosaccharide translocation protein RFT1 [Schizothecium conicum]